MLAKSQTNITYYSCHFVHFGFTWKHGASSLHNNQMSVGSATDGILLKTRLAFELLIAVQNLDL